MSHDLLEKILSDSINSDIDAIINFFSNYKKGDFIYPSVLKRYLNIDEKEIYKILSILEKSNLLKIYYEYFCYNCNRSSELYEYYSKLPESYICENCEDNLTLGNVRVVYKVI